MLFGIPYDALRVFTTDREITMIITHINVLLKCKGSRVKWCFRYRLIFSYNINRKHSKNSETPAYWRDNTLLNNVITFTSIKSSDNCVPCRKQRTKTHNLSNAQLTYMLDSR